MGLLLADKRVMKVKLEATKGLKVAGDSAIYVEDLTINPTFEFTERPGGGLYLAPVQGDIRGPAMGECSFTTELKGNGTTGLDAAVDILFQGCGLLKAGLVLNTHSTIAAMKTISIDVWEDGNKKGLSGAMGNAVITGVYGDRVIVNFTFIGAWVPPTAEALPAFAPGTEPPMRWDTGAFTFGGQAVKVANPSLDLGMNVRMREDASLIAQTNWHAIITRPRPILTIDPEEELVGTFDFNGLLLSGATSAVSMVPQSAATKLAISLPAVQIIGLDGNNRDNLKTNDLTGLCINSSGNDAVTMTSAAA